jgi:hypothetical protein
MTECIKHYNTQHRFDGQFRSRYAEVFRGNGPVLELRAPPAEHAMVLGITPCLPALMS